MLCYEPLTGAMDGWIPIHVGSSPYASLYCPYRALYDPIGVEYLSVGVYPYVNGFPVLYAPVGG